MHKLAFTIDEAVECSAIGRTALYLAMKAKQLPARKAGRRTIILASDLIAFLESLPVREVV